MRVQLTEDGWHATGMGPLRRILGLGQTRKEATKNFAACYCDQIRELEEMYP